MLALLCVALGSRSAGAEGPAGSGKQGEAGEQAQLVQQAPVIKKKRPLDKTKPGRFETLMVIESATEGTASEPQLLAELLRSHYLILDDQTRFASTYLFSRELLRLPSRRKFAYYSEFLAGDEKQGHIRGLLVDVDRGRYVLLTRTVAVSGPGYRKLAEALDETPEGEVLWSVTTRTLRQGPVKLELLRDSPFPQVLYSEEKELFADLEEVRQVLGCAEFPGKWCWGILRDLEQLLKLPPAKPCQCQDRKVALALANDEPQAAEPLDPAFEAAFGKWVSWRELPKLK